MFTEMKIEDIDRAIHAKKTLALSECKLEYGRGSNASHRDVVDMPIIHLTEEDVPCHHNHSFTVFPSSFLIIVFLFLKILCSITNALFIVDF